MATSKKTAPKGATGSQETGASAVSEEQSGEVVETAALPEGATNDGGPEVPNEDAHYVPGDDPVGNPDPTQAGGGVGSAEKPAAERAAEIELAKAEQATVEAKRFEQAEEDADKGPSKADMEGDDEPSAKMSEGEALESLEKVVAEHPGLIARLQRLLGISEAQPNDANDKGMPVEEHSRVSSLPINPYAVGNMDHAKAARLVGMEKKDVRAFTCRGGMPDENMAIEDPNVYVSVVTHSGEHHVAKIPD